MAKRILIIGESWITRSVPTKGYDSFQTAMFGQRFSGISEVLRGCGFGVDVIEGHAISMKFKSDPAFLAQYSTIMISDIGANSFLLAPEEWADPQPRANKLTLLADYTRNGGGLIMVGGYLTFMGVGAKGFWRNTPVEDVLPVTMLPNDDRVEYNEGIGTKVLMPEHEILSGVTGEWPLLLGYNRVKARPNAAVLATVGGDPLIVAGQSGAGRALAFTTDLSPHWCPQRFLDWPGYKTLWNNMCSWTSQPPQSATRAA